MPSLQLLGRYFDFLRLPLHVFAVEEASPQFSIVLMTHCHQYALLTTIGTVHVLQSDPVLTEDNQDSTGQIPYKR
ncbi:hypothetical protein [Thalassoglobus sp.]|uniref:hypothetical protein n=1 Tax=Thalassoglobus sp. TaxID=2795869 RepID=UPI003AA7B8E7